MSWSIEEHIGDCRPFPARVVVYKGETDECLAYVSSEIADKLKAENTKLRKLVRDWYALAVVGANSLTDWNHNQADLEQRMRELGIEVDE